MREELGNLLKIVCLDTNRAYLAKSLIEDNRCVAIVVGSAVITNHKLNGESFAKIVVQLEGYTSNVTNYDKEQFIKHTGGKL